MDNQENISNILKDLEENIKKNENEPSKDFLGDFDILYDNLSYLTAILSVAIPEHLDISTLSHLIHLSKNIAESSLLIIDKAKLGDDESKNTISFLTEQQPKI